MDDRSSTEIEAEMAPALQALGLFCLGWFVMADSPFENRKAVLIGNHANNGTHDMFRIFSRSREATDGRPDPLDRWTERVTGSIADHFGATAIYPFGEKMWPFQRYAMAATGMKSSPLGLLIHPQYGLWQAFRSVFVFDKGVVLDASAKTGQAGDHPCDTCAEKPCLNTCPVGAFTPEGFAVADCRGHLNSGNRPDCMVEGCRARAACPVGTPYSDAQIRFHMRAFGRA